jgi:hypothetical protein
MPRQLCYLIVDLNEATYDPVADAYTFTRATLVNAETRARTFVPEQIVEWETARTPQVRTTKVAVSPRVIPVERPHARKIDFD